MNFSYAVLFLFFVIELGSCHNKYSKEANKPKDDNNDMPTMRDLNKPFRMQKINLLWEKAKIRLTEPKLRSLYGELKIHDKEEITWKQLRGEGKDKDGLKEAELRRKLLSIMSMYGLLEHFEDTGDIKKTKDNKLFNEASEEHINKSLFKDKKLNKLWSKAEAAGFTTIELEALREEFNHHQDKIDQYYSILHDVKEGPKDSEGNTIDDGLDRFNMLETGEIPVDQDYINRVNVIRDKHRDLKDGYDRLFLLASKGPNNKEFVEPKVQGLWKIALQSNFSATELESLRVELLHYEDRLLKLRHLQAEAALAEKHLKKESSGVKSDGAVVMEDNIKKQARKVEKIHLSLETKIMQKHIEL